MRTGALKITLVLVLACLAVNVGARNDQFGFTILGTNNQVIVVEASSSLTNATWSPLKAVTLTGGSSYFTDSQWTNYPARFYRTLTLDNRNSLWKVPPFGVEPWFWKGP